MSILLRAITDSIQSIESITAGGPLIELGILSKVWMGGREAAGG
jgi:hypothetical protein